MIVPTVEKDSPAFDDGKVISQPTVLANGCSELNGLFEKLRRSFCGAQESQIHHLP